MIKMIYAKCSIIVSVKNAFLLNVDIWVPGEFVYNNLTLVEAMIFSE